MLNIFYISNKFNFDGGAPRSIYEFLKNIDRKRINPFFASIHEGPVTREIKSLDIPFLHLKPYKYTPPLFAFSSINPISTYIRNNEIDLIHNNQCDDALYSWLPAKITRTPIIIHHRDSSFYKRNRFLLNHSDGNIAISNWQNEKNLNGKGTVIHNGIEPEKYLHANSNARLKLDLSPTKLTVGVIGRLVYFKGQDVFVKAAQLVLEIKKDIQFVIIGDEQDPISKNYIDTLKQSVRDLRLHGSVIFTGKISDSASAVQLLDICVVPSRKEPFGRVLIEAMAAKKPVIATNIWGALDIVTPDTGILVPPEDPKKLADAILELTKDPEKRKTMGENGYRRVVDKFTLNQMMDKIYSYYEKILSRKMHHRLNKKSAVI